MRTSDLTIRFDGPTSPADLSIAPIGFPLHPAHPPWALWQRLARCAVKILYGQANISIPRYIENQGILSTYQGACKPVGLHSLVSESRQVVYTFPETLAAQDVSQMEDGHFRCSNLLDTDTPILGDRRARNPVFRHCLSPNTANQSMLLCSASSNEACPGLGSVKSCRGKLC